MAYQSHSSLADPWCEQYPSCNPSWVDYIPRCFKQQPTTVRHFSSNLELVVPAPASPAILAYLTLVNKLSVSWETANYAKPLYPTVDVARSRHSSECDCDWARIHSLANPDTLLNNTLSGSFLPGSLEGVWEGIFTVCMRLWWRRADRSHQCPTTVHGIHIIRGTLDRCSSLNSAA